MPAAGMVIVTVDLADGVNTTVAHKLGRPPRAVVQGLVRGAASAGIIRDLTTAARDRSKTLLLRADGYGATITVDILFY